MSRFELQGLLRGHHRFDPGVDELDWAFVDRGVPVVRRLSRYFRPSFFGMENIPASGPALLAGNHGLFAFDGFILFTEIYQRTGRLARGLGEGLLFAFPLSKTFWTKLGAIEGTPENAVRALRAGNLVNVYPGGARDALKSPEQRYRLQWERSKGFVKVAMAAEVPVILHMSIGPDDAFRSIGRVGWTGRMMGDPKYGVPLLWGLGPLPRPVKFTYYISEPITLEGGPEDVKDRALVDRNHRILWERGQWMLDEGLRRRRSLWLG